MTARKSGMHRQHTIRREPSHLELEPAGLHKAFGRDLTGVEQPLEMDSKPVASDVREIIKVRMPVGLGRDFQANALEQVRIDTQIRHATPPALANGPLLLSGDNEWRKGWLRRRRSTRLITYSVKLT